MFKTFSKILIVSSLFLVALGASALSCMQSTLDADVNIAEFIFVGKVVSVNSSYKDVDYKGGAILTTNNQADFATFEVQKYWKGGVRATQNIYGIYAWPYTQGSYFVNGQTYIVFASKDPNSGKILASLNCGRTTTFTSDFENQITNIVGAPRYHTLDSGSGDGDGDMCQYTNLSTNMYYRSFSNYRPDVLTLQNFLFRKYSAMGEVQPNGFFGSLTKNFVLKFQGENGLKQTGNVGIGTRNKIKEVCGQTVGGGGCTKEYMPVCGQPKWSCPPGLNCATVMEEPKTYSNKCVMNAAGASFLYGGACKGDTVSEPFGPSCKSWFDGCNTCSRSYTGGPAVCTMMACVNTSPTFANSPAYCKEYFSGIKSAITIKSFSGPVVLQTGQTGTWKVVATEPNNSELNYNITWGDEKIYAVMSNSMRAYDVSVAQKTTFEHTYNAPGTYTVTIRISSAGMKEVTTTGTVVVKSDYYTTGCYIESKQHPEGTSKNHMPQACVTNSRTPCFSGGTVSIMDASYVCRSGSWSIEGSLPYR